MSSNTVSQILQFTAGRGDSQPAEPTAAQGDEFRRQLIRASAAGEQLPATQAEPVESTEAEPTVSAENQQDAAHADDQHDDAPATLAAVEVVQPVSEAEVDELLLDELELSEAAVFAVTTQAIAPTEFPVESLEVALAPTHAPTVIDATAAQLPAESAATQPAEPQLAAAEVVTEVAASVEVPAENADKTEVVKAVEQSFVGHTTSGELQTEAAPIVEPAVRTPESSTTKKPTPAPKSAKPAATTAAESVVDAEVVPQEEPVEKLEIPKQVIPTGTAVPIEQETLVADEVKAPVDNSKIEAKSADAPALHTASRESNEIASSADSSAATQPAPEGDAVSTLDRVRFVQRVARAFQSAEGRDGVIQMRLSPPELGSLKISITTQHGVLSAQVEADTAAARNVILDNLPALRERLAEQQIRLERFDVDVRRDGGQNPSHWEATDRQAKNSEQTHAANRLRPAAAAVPQTTHKPGGVTDRGLDIRI